MGPFWPLWVCFSVFWGRPGEVYGNGRFPYAYLGSLRSRFGSLLGLPGVVFWPSGGSLGSSRAPFGLFGGAFRCALRLVNIACFFMTRGLFVILMLSFWLAPVALMRGLLRYCFPLAFRKGKTCSENTLADFLITFRVSGRIPEYPIPSVPRDSRTPHPDISKIIPRRFQKLFSEVPLCIFYAPQFAFGAVRNQPRRLRNPKQQHKKIINKIRGRSGLGLCCSGKTSAVGPYWNSLGASAS